MLINIFNWLVFHCLLLGSLCMSVLTCANLMFCLQIHTGDFVKVCPDDPHKPLFISCVCYMWEAVNGDKMFHCRWLRYKPVS